MSAKSQSSNGDVGDGPADKIRQQLGKKNKAKRAERAEAAGRQEAVLNHLRDETVSLPFAGQTFEFDTLDGDQSDRVAKLDETIARIGGEDFRKEFDSEVEWMCSLLDAKSKPEWMDYDFWKYEVSFTKRKKVLTMLFQEFSPSEEQVKKLQEAGML